LAGKEFEVGKNKVLGLGVKVTGAGGKRRGTVDHVASNEQGEVIFLDEGFNEDKFKDYFRFDIKTTFKINQEEVTHEIGIDLVNLTSAKNILNYSYAPNNDGVADQNDIALNYQLGFLPIFYYRIDF
jgi:hypothetical protein